MACRHVSICIKCVYVYERERERERQAGRQAGRVFMYISICVHRRLCFLCVFVYTDIHVCTKERGGERMHIMCVCVCVCACSRVCVCLSTRMYLRGTCTIHCIPFIDRSRFSFHALWRRTLPTVRWTPAR